MVAGVSKDFDLSLKMGYLWLRDEDNEGPKRDQALSDSALSARYRFYNKEDLKLEVAWITGLTFPTGNHKKGFGSGKPTSGLVLITTKELERGAIHLNFGYTRNENEVDERENIWNASIAGEIEIIANLKLVMDIVMEANPDKTSNVSSSFILGGFIYSVLENLDLDIGYRYGLTKPADDHSILAGMAVRF